MLTTSTFYQKIFFFTFFIINTIYASNAFLNSVQEENESKPYILGQRPVTIQKQIDICYQKIITNPSWSTYNGDRGFYQLMGIDETKILRKLAFENNQKNEVYILDIGCAQGGWGNAVCAFLQKECSDSDKKFHIFSVTGGLEQENETVAVTNNITHYRFNQCKIENIEEFFLNLDFNPYEKFDFIVSYWTLNHLVDPVGTINQIYNLLSSNNGMFFTTGFLFSEDDTSKIKSIRNTYNIFGASSATSLFKYTAGDDHTDHMLLVRTNQAPLNLPLSYTGKIKFFNGSSRSESNCLTVFNVLPNLANTESTNYTANYDDSIVDSGGNCVHFKNNHLFYSQKGNIKSNQLFNQLVQENLFVFPIKSVRKN